MLFRVAALALLIAAASTVCAQEALNEALRLLDNRSTTLPENDLPSLEISAGDEGAKNQSAAVDIHPSVALQPASGTTMAQSAWLDLRQNAAASSSRQTAPEWVAGVTMTPASEGNDVASKTVFRIQVTRPLGDYEVLFFRLFFDDKPDARPELVAWDESGSQILRSDKLGSGIELPSSDSAIIPMHGISTIDIEVPGDGKTVRGAYLDWMTSSDIVHPLNVEHRDLIPEPFSAMPPLHSSAEDTEKFGTITATLAAETIRIGPTIEEGAAFEFGMEAQPLLALLTFEVASPHIDAPPEIYVNGQDIGAVSLALPELADPGYRGETEPLVSQMRFRYTGWLRAQKIVSASALKTGTNSLVVLSGAGTSASAIRTTQIQLKYLWDKSDYILKPGR